MTQFICIITCIQMVEGRPTSNSSAILFNSFEEAFEWAKDDAEYYKHSASEYTEEIGIYRRHANIRLFGKYINKSYRISDLSKNVDPITVNTKDLICTYVHWDYLPNDMAI